MANNISNPNKKTKLSDKNTGCFVTHRILFIYQLFRNWKLLIIRDCKWCGASYKKKHLCHFQYCFEFHFNFVICLLHIKYRRNFDSFIHTLSITVPYHGLLFHWTKPMTISNFVDGTKRNTNQTKWITLLSLFLSHSIGFSVTL